MPLPYGDRNQCQMLSFPKKCYLSGALKVVHQLGSDIPQIGGSAIAGKWEKPEESVSKLRQVEVL